MARRYWEESDQNLVREDLGESTDTDRCRFQVGVKQCRLPRLHLGGHKLGTPRKPSAKKEART